MDTSLYLTSGPLRLSLTSGRVYRTAPDDPDAEREPEFVGYITDDEAEPWDLSEDWGNLLSRWNDAMEYGRACEATARWTYETMSRAHSN